jgi:serine protease Do
VVADVTPDSPAAKAGIKSGDIITKFDGREVRDSRHLKLQVAQAAPGKALPITVNRDGKTRTLQVTPKELPGTELAARSGSSSSSDDNGTLNGVTVSDLDEAARSEMKVPAHIKGALVTDVRPDSPAYQAGLRPGDVILEIDRKAVNGAEDAVKLTEQDHDKRSLLRVWSKGGTRYVVVDESKVG